jgi:hypothetical protein
MRKSVYLETTIPSYLTARRSRDLIRAAQQELTREWWEVRRGEYDLRVSQAVIEEAGQGDTEAAERRLASLDGVPLLEVNAAAAELADALIRVGALPPEAEIDALHIALATVHDVDILLTWNCTHLANPDLLGGVLRVIWSKGYTPPVICTPGEMMGDWT